MSNIQINSDHQSGEVNEISDEDQWRARLAAMSFEEWLAAYSPGQHLHSKMDPEMLAWYYDQRLVHHDNLVARMREDD